MEKFHMASEHSIRPVEDDIIFATSKQAVNAIANNGFNNVINSTIGALLDDNGKLITFNSVFNVLRNLPDEEIGAYAPLSGLPEFLDKAIDATFGNYRPDSYIESVATPGGSGAIRHAVWNYTNMGDEIFTSDWYWGPYNTIASEHGRKITTYKLFNNNMGFNIESFDIELGKLIERQNRVLILLNSPAHNPTGYSLSYSEWESVIDTIKKYSKKEKVRITLFIDVAYIDFCKEHSRKFFELIGNLPENILCLVAFSMSKGYTFYGLRSGALLGVSSNKDIAKEFYNVCSFSNRGVWSNGTRSAMKVLSNIYNNKELYNNVEEERNTYKLMLNNRAQAFIDNANKLDLEICPYKDGFFISIPHEKPMLLAEELKKQNAYLIPLSKGLRFAVCSVSEEKCKKTPELIKNAIERL